MLTDILSLSVLVRIAFLVAATAVDASDHRRQLVQLAAQVAAIDPQLERRLRQVSRRIATLVKTLEGELQRFRPLEQRFEQVAGQVVGACAEDQDGELFECLAERFGVLRVRPALQRLLDGHPDTPDRGQG